MNRVLVIDALTELGRRDVQEELWLSDGSGGALVSSFVEAWERLADDSGLRWEIEAGSDELGEGFLTWYKRLEGLLRDLERAELDPRALIDDDRMVEVRRVCNRLLDIIA